jgi:lipid A 3-O-deacylase
MAQKGRHLRLVPLRPGFMMPAMNCCRAHSLLTASGAVVFFMVSAASAQTPAASDAETPAVSAVDETVVTETMHKLRWGSFSIYNENDKYFAGTDQHYTNGFKVSWLSTDLRSFRGAEVPAAVRSISSTIDQWFDPSAQLKLGLSFGQNFFTPVDTQNPDYIPDDRPYAAWLYVGTAFHNYVPAKARASGSLGPATLDVFELNFGVVGPWALGEEVQNGFHNLIGVETAKGWEHQIENEFGFNFIYERKWRFSSRDARTSWGTDVIPHLGFSLGNVYTYANAGLELRAGYCLPADFGTSLIRPSGDSNAVRRPKYNCFLFAMTDGRAVARDITLDGNTFQESNSIPKESFVLDYSIGFGVGGTGWQLTYSQASRSEEFKGQDGWQNFGSLSFSWFF